MGNSKDMSRKANKMIASHMPALNRKRVITSAVLALAISFGSVISPAGFDLVPAASAADCRAGHNLGENANSYISRCRHASVRREFPKEFLDKTLGEIKSTPGKPARTAWKLLNDKRWDR